MMLHGSLVEQLLVLPKVTDKFSKSAPSSVKEPFGFHSGLGGTKVYGDVGQVECVLSNDHIFQVMEGTEPI